MKLPMHSSNIAKTNGAFIAKDLRPYLVLRNDGFLAIMRSLGLRLVVPQHLMSLLFYIFWFRIQ